MGYGFGKFVIKQLSIGTMMHFKVPDSYDLSRIYSYIYVRIVAIAG